jgi:predicted MPP superfamily phosphohydrolase
LPGLVIPRTAAYAAAQALHDLIVTDYRPVPPDWPDAHRLSIRRRRSSRRRSQYGAGARAAVLIVILGDYFPTHRFVTERVPHPLWAAEFGRLLAPLGVFLGNHDWWYDIKGMRSALAAVRIPVLENDAVLLKDRGRSFWLAGLGN